MRDNIKKITAITLLCIGLPLIAVFFLWLCLADVMDLLYLRDVIYLNWRVFPILSCIPFLVYMELLFISCFFTKDKKAHPYVEKYMTIMTGVSVLLFCISIFIGPALNIGLAFSSWHSCPVGGGFSGVYYVKDKNKCSTLTSAVPWGGSKDKTP